MKVLILIVCLFACLSAFSTRSFAVDFTVNLVTDEHDASPGDGICDTDAITTGEQCSIRAAVEEANNLASNDRILFSLPVNSIVTLTAANGGEILITDKGALEILGSGANLLTIDGGAGANRIFRINFAMAAISGVTLTGGNPSTGGGGAISTLEGSLTLDRVHITGNSVRSTFPGSSGGGVFFIGGINRISNSTFSGNTARNCGGFLYSQSDFINSILTVENSTISGNTAAIDGGGFCNDGNTTLRNVTITNNVAGNGGDGGGGGGIAQFSGALNFGNTIIAGNSALDGFPPDLTLLGNGTITSAGGNLVGDVPGDSTNTFNPVTYHPTDIRDINPLLGALADNGGTTPTHALLARSPAIDAGLNTLAVDPFTNSVLLTDQRGFARIVDGDGNGTATVDIGAFEFMATNAATVSISGRVTSGKHRSVANAVVQITDQSGEIKTTKTNSFGYYNFDEIMAGETYIFNVFAKRFQFDAQVVNITESLDELNFTAQVN